MKGYKVFWKIKSVCLILALFCVFSVVTVGAEPTVSDENTPEYSEPQEYPEEIPEEIPEEYPEETPEDYPEEETQGEVTEETYTEDITESIGETEPTKPLKETEPEPTYRQPLPEIEAEDIVIPEAIGSSKEENEPKMFWGFVSWICIGVGVAVILAVLLTTKTRAYRSGGKKRYSTGDKISGKQRLLNDKYYNNKRR